MIQNSTLKTKVMKQDSAEDNDSYMNSKRYHDNNKDYVSFKDKGKKSTGEATEETKKKKSSERI